MTRQLFMICTAFLFSANIYAEQMYSPPLIAIEYMCHIVNVSEADVEIKSMSLRNFEGSDMPVTGSCSLNSLGGFTIKPQHVCLIASKVPAAGLNFGIYCRVEHAGEDGAIVGALQVGARDPSEVGAAVQLRVVQPTQRKQAIDGLTNSR